MTDTQVKYAIPSTPPPYCLTNQREIERERVPGSWLGHSFFPWGGVIDRQERDRQRDRETNRKRGKDQNRLDEKQRPSIRERTAPKTTRQPRQQQRRGQVGGEVGTVAAPSTKGL